jgi:type IV secretory pathway protease TraF
VLSVADKLPTAGANVHHLHSRGEFPEWRSDWPWRTHLRRTPVTHRKLYPLQADRRTAHPRWQPSSRAVRGGQHLCVRPLGLERFRHHLFAHHILRAVTEGQRYATVSGFRPGGEILLRLAGWRKIVRVLEAIDIVEALGIHPADAAPEHSARPQPYVRQRKTSAIHAHQASGLAPAAKHRRMKRFSFPLLTTAAATTVLLITMAWSQIPRVVWNASERAPIGLYRVHTTRKLMINDLVIAMPPEPLATFLADGGYLPRGVPLIKHILALSGQTVCHVGLNIVIEQIEEGKQPSSVPSFSQGNLVKKCVTNRSSAESVEIL